jgi:hypothetical protein
MRPARLAAIALVLVLAAPAGAVVSTTTSVVEYTCNGTLKNFSVPFKFLDQAHLRVSRVLIASPYTETVLTLTTDYMVAGAGAATGGTVVLGAPASSCASSSYKLRVQRLTPRTQSTPFSTQGAFSPKAHEAAFDRQTMIAQELNDGALLQVQGFNFLGPDASLGNVTATGSTTPRPLADRFADTVNVLDFAGVDPTGATDSTVAIQNAIDTGKNVFIPAGTYLVDNVQPHSNQRIFGAGWASILKQKSGATYLLSINPGTGGSADPSTNVRNVVIQDLTLYGRVEADGFAQGNHLANLNAVSDVVIERVQFKAMQGDGVYLGSSNVAGTERHNQRVTIRDCAFDGVTSQNRNGISVIDGDGVTIENNYCTRISRSDMPGCIDLEPNQYAFAVLRNIIVRGNRGDTIGGNMGMVNLALTLAGYAYTNPPRNIIVENNTVVGSPGYAFQWTGGHASDSTPPLDLVVRGNKVFGAVGRGLYVTGLRGVRIEANQILGTTQDIFIGWTTGTVVDVDVIENLFDSVASVDTTGIRVLNAKRIRFLRNRFRDVYGSGLVFGTGSTENVTVDGNVFASPTPGRMARAVQQDATHTTTPASNTLRANKLEDSVPWTTDPTKAFQAYASDAPIKGPFDSSTLPDSFPVGTSTALVNGDGGLPLGTQGLLRTEVGSQFSGYRKFIIQWFNPAFNDATSEVRIYFRKANSGANTWGAWHYLAGT